MPKSLSEMVEAGAVAAAGSGAGGDVIGSPEEVGPLCGVSAMWIRLAVRDGRLRASCAKPLLVWAADVRAWMATLPSRAPPPAGTVTLTEAAQILGCSRSAVWAAVARGRLTAIRRGKRGPGSGAWIAQDELWRAWLADRAARGGRTGRVAASDAQAATERTRASLAGGTALLRQAVALGASPVPHAWRVWRAEAQAWLDLPTGAVGGQSDEVPRE